MHHKNSIIPILLMGGFLALSLAACESPQPPYPNGSYPTTTLQNGPTTTLQNGPTTTLQNGPTTTLQNGTTTTSSTTTTAPTTTVCATHPVGMNNFAFTPQSLTINRCDKVTWTHQQANVLHTVTSDTAVFDSRGGNPTTCSGPGNIPAAGCMSVGDTFSHTFASSGTFPYQCVVHGAGGMTGTITVNP